MAVGLHRNAQIVINKNAIFKNIKTEKDKLNADTSLFAVVKANAYGHGAIEVANVAKKAGADGFCVAILDEALELREAGISEPILVLGISRVEDVKIIVENNISVAVSSLKWLQEAEKLMKAECIKVHCSYI